MATTLAGVYIDGDDLITFNVGDSRVYRIRDGLMMRLTHDHSEVQELLDHGYIDEAEAMNHPKRSIITRFIGHPQLCLPDIVKYEGKFLPGDLLLLCSDGLTDQLEEEEIENIMDVEGVSLQLRAWQLIHLTHEKGGFDNTSIILIHKNGVRIGMTDKNKTESMPGIQRKWGREWRPRLWVMVQGLRCCQRTVNGRVLKGRQRNYRITDVLDASTGGSLICTYARGRQGGERCRYLRPRFITVPAGLTLK